MGRQALKGENKMSYEYNPLIRYKDISEDVFKQKLSEHHKFNSGFGQEVFMRATDTLASDADMGELSSRYTFTTKMLELSQLCFANGLLSESDGFLSVYLSQESEYDKQRRYDAEWRKFAALVEYCDKNGLW